MDHRAVRLALGLTIAGASMLTAGVATWLITAMGRVTSGAAARDLRLAALVLLAGGAACGLAMGVAMVTAGRARPGAPPGTGPAAGGLMPGGTEAPPAAQPLDGPRSLMNPPPPSPPPPWSQEQWSQEQWAPEQGSPGQWSKEQWSKEQGSQEQASGDPGPADRVWWRAAHSPGSGWDDTSEEWLRSLRGPVIQQPPPHSAE
jgi:hypothetical protein